MRQLFKNKSSAKASRSNTPTDCENIYTHTLLFFTTLRTYANIIYSLQYAINLRKYGSTKNADVKCGFSNSYLIISITLHLTYETRRDKQQFQRAKVLSERNIQQIGWRWLSAVGVATQMYTLVCMYVKQAIKCMSANRTVNKNKLITEYICTHWHTSRY